MRGVQSWVFTKVNPNPKISVNMNKIKVSSPEYESFPSENWSTAVHTPVGIPETAAAIQVA